MESFRGHFLPSEYIYCHKTIRYGCQTAAAYGLFYNMIVITEYSHQNHIHHSHHHWSVHKTEIYSAHPEKFYPQNPHSCLPSHSPSTLPALLGSSSVHSTVLLRPHSVSLSIAKPGTIVGNAIWRWLNIGFNNIWDRRQCFLPLLLLLSPPTCPGFERGVSGLFNSFYIPLSGHHHQYFLSSFTLFASQWWVVLFFVLLLLFYFLWSIYHSIRT